jgi:ABC-type multidrug transport system fused ATPase/permease subunit
MTAIVGPSGAGKSTLVDLLPRLRVPQKGQVLFDDHPVETYDLGSLRRGLGFVSQDAFIFNDSVFGNITFAQTGMNEEEVWEVLEKAGGAEFVRQMPNGLYTVLGERGVNLSGGQKQRLSLARALMQKAPVLILDEPTSSLDSESEKHIQRAINEIMAKKNITMITIAHRLSTIKNADQIIVLDKGRVLECGSHRELMHDHHWYAEMVKIQAV